MPRRDGPSNEIQGELPHGFRFVKAGATRPPSGIAKKAVAMVRQAIGLAAAFKMPATIDDPAIRDEIAAALKEAGYAKT